MSAFVNVTAFQYLKDFPDEVHDDKKKKKMTVFMLCSDMCQHLEEPGNSVNQ